MRLRNNFTAETDVSAVFVISLFNSLTRRTVFIILIVLFMELGIFTVNIV